MAQMIEQLTRDEFIAAHMARYGLLTAMRTPNGFRHGNYERVSRKCNCGAPRCPGWEMVDPNRPVDAGHGEI